MKLIKHIRDPIHGTIPLNEVELELLDTPQVQRMRHIKQNGLCFLVYPAMNSTRFEHSLGVMYIAGLIAENLELSDDDRIKLEVAGLLHDIGHCPFSHTSDDVLIEMGHSHEELSIHLIRETTISDILKKHGIDPRAISELINGRGKLGKIISSEIDADKMDYLIRDSYYAGVAYGVIDMDRIIQGIKLVKGEVVVKRGSLEAVESLLISRNMMYETVYRHHTKRIVEAMFKAALNKLIRDKQLTYREFIKMDDIDLVYKLRNTGGYPGDMMERIDKRKLFKTAYSERLSLVDEGFREDLVGGRVNIQDKIAQDYAIDEGYLLLDIPETKMSEFKILVEGADGELKLINEVSELAGTLEKTEREKITFGIYTPKEKLPNLAGFNAERYIEFSQTRLGRYM
ncbi:MAG: HD domain-containing protein [Candidatus Altiarchaeales archaeon]|nr:HD domain-containing protein [Candidatus Altiarchaeales archaeon]